jgi:hypothetical protein
VTGLDVETTLGSRALCLVQIAGPGFIAVIDALASSDLAGLAALLGDAGVVKVTTTHPSSARCQAPIELPSRTSPTPWPARGAWRA